MKRLARGISEETRMLVRGFGLLVVVGALSGCTEKKEAAAPPAQVAKPAEVAPAAAAPAAAPAAAAEPDLAAAKEIFGSRCMPCHGAEGGGDGPASAGLVPKPRNFKDKAWQDTVKDDYLEKIILGGGLAVGKSAAMPPNPDLDGKPAVVAGLRAHIRSLAK